MEKAIKAIKTIYFVRHGQTVANISGQIQGPDDPLNERGIMQAQILSERISDFNFDKIITSDYIRARATAEVIQKVSTVPLEFSEYFREYRRPSEFWGRVPKDEQEILDVYQVINDNFFDPHWHHSDEENFFDLKARGEKALRHLLNQPEDKILVVTHGNFLRCLLGLILRGDQYSPQDYLDIEATFELNNTSITVAEYKYHWRKDHDIWMISRWNDDIHI